MLGKTTWPCGHIQDGYMERIENARESWFGGVL